MPFVRSYFRRAPGAALAGAPVVRGLDVAIYAADGTNLLREATGGRYRVASLAFDSGLPGGFLTATLTLAMPTARSWPGRAGLRVIIRRGNRVLWWGWIEDIRRLVRGGVEGLTLTCLGPWQQLQQRLCSPAYTGTLTGDNAIALELTTACDDISPDYSALTATGVNMAPLTWTNRPVSELVKAVCQAGNSSGQQMLFGIWEPSGRSRNGYPTAINTNPHFETLAGALHVGWTSVTITGAPVVDYAHALYHSPIYAPRFRRGAEAGTQSARLSTDSGYFFAVTPAATYVVDYWAYFGATASISCYARLNWYNSGGGLISQVALTVRNSTGSAFGARFVESTVAPALAATCRLDLVLSLPDSGANAYIVFDDCYVYALGAPIAADREPRAHLWARDLSTADYRLYTSELATALDIDESTRELANYVLGQYSTSYTAAAQDAASLLRYRRREAIANAGAVSSTVATAMRDAYLALHKAPMIEPGAFRLTRPGAIRTLHGTPIWPEELRAGDRLEIADGPLAGQIIMLSRVAYADGVVSCTPERPADVPLLLARR